MSAEHVIPEDGWPHQIIDCACAPRVEFSKETNIPVKVIHHSRKGAK